MSSNAAWSSAAVCAVSRSTSPPSERRRARWPPLRSDSRAVGRLRHERQPLRREPVEDARVERGAEVVRVRQEQVPVAALQQLVEHPRGRRATCRRRRGRAAPTRATGRPASRPARGRRRAASAPCPGRSRAAGRRPPARGSRRAPRACRRGWRSCSSAAAGCARRCARAGAAPGGRSRRGRQAVLDLDQRLRAVIPMLVPRPPLSFSTTACVERRAPSELGSSAASGRSTDRLDLGLAQQPLVSLLEGAPRSGRRSPRRCPGGPRPASSRWLRSRRRS